MNRSNRPAVDSNGSLLEYERVDVSDRGQVENFLRLQNRAAGSTTRLSIIVGSITAELVAYSILTRHGYNGRAASLPFSGKTLFVACAALLLILGAQTACNIATLCKSSGSMKEGSLGIDKSGLLSAKAISLGLPPTHEGRIRNVKKLLAKSSVKGFLTGAIAIGAFTYIRKTFL